MADEISDNTPPPEVSAASEQTGSAGVDDLGALLADFDQQMGGSQPAANAPAPEPSQMPSKPEASQDHDAQRPTAQPADLFGGMEPRALDHRDAHEDELNGLRGRVQALEAVRLAEQRATFDKHSLDRVMSEFAQEIAELKYLPPDLIAHRLRAEEQLNPELSNALAHRYDSEEAYGRAMTLSRRAVAKIVREAEKDNAFRDPENIALTLDREAVSHAVRNAGGPPPPPKPPKLGKMTDSELTAFTEQTFGYRPKSFT